MNDNKLTRISIDIPLDVKKKFMTRCIEDGESMASVVRRLILTHLGHELDLENPPQEFLDAIKALNIELAKQFNTEITPEKLMEIKKAENLEIAKRLEYYGKTQARIELNKKKREFQWKKMNN